MPNDGPKNNESAFVNLDSDIGPGTHWTAYEKFGKIVKFFDSYGNLKPPIELIRYFGDAKIYYNHTRYQKNNSYNCGHLCIAFLRK